MVLNLFSKFKLVEKKNVYLYNVFDIKINVGSNKNVNIIVCFKNILKIGLVFCRFWKWV